MEEEQKWKVLEAVQNMREFMREEFAKQLSAFDGR